MKKFISLLLALCLLTAMLPTTALADEGTPGVEAGSSAGEAAASPEPVQEPDPASAAPEEPDSAPEESEDPAPEPTEEPEPDPAPEPEELPEDADLVPLADAPAWSAPSYLDLGEPDENGVPSSVALNITLNAGVSLGDVSPIIICCEDSGAQVTMGLKFKCAYNGTYRKNMTTVSLAKLELGEGFNGSLTIPEGVTNVDYTLKALPEGVTSLSIPNSWSTTQFISCPGVTKLTAKSANVFSMFASTPYFPGLEELDIEAAATPHPSSGSTPATKIDANKFGEKTPASLKVVTIAGSVQEVADKAFYKTPGLETVTIGETVTKIGKDAFFQCPNLQTFAVDPANPIYEADGEGRLIETASGKVVAPAEIPNYDNDPEYMPDPNDPNRVPKKLAPLPEAGVEIPKNAASAEYKYAWQDMGPLLVYWGWKQTGPATGVYTDTVLSKCDEGASGRLVVPEGITKIQYSNYEADKGKATGFANCAELTEVVIADSVTEIMDNAFSGCGKLAKVTIGRNVSKIGIDVFAGCPENLRFEVAEGNATFTAKDGKLYQGDTLLYPIPNYDHDPEYMPDPADPNRVPKKIAPVPQDGVKQPTSSGLQKYSWQDMGVLSVGWKDKDTPVVTGCSPDAAGVLTIPAGVKEIRDGAFAQAANLTKVVIGKDVAVIGKDVFDFAANPGLLFDIDPENTTFTARYGKLYQDGALVYPIPNYDSDPEYMPDPQDPNRVPKKLAPVPQAAGAATPAPPINRYGTLQAVGRQKYSWQDMGVLSVGWLDSETPVVTSCDRAASGTVTIPEGVKEICDRAFSQATGLTKVVIGKDVSWIGKQAFGYAPEPTVAFEVAEGNATFTARDGKLYIGDTPVYPVPNYTAQEDYKSDLTYTGTGTEAVFNVNNGIPKRIAPAPQSGVTKSALDKGGSAFDWQSMGPLTVSWEDNYQTAVLKSCAPSLKAGTAYRAPTVNISGELVIPEGIQKIASGAFSDFDLCARLTKVTIGKDVTYIGSNAFNFAANPDLWFDVAEGNTVFTAQDGKLYMDGRQILPVLKNPGQDGEYGLVTGEGVVPAPKAIAPAPAMGARVPRTKEEAMDPAFACEWQDMGALKVYWEESGSAAAASPARRAAKSGGSTLVPVLCGCAGSAQGELTIPEGIARIDDETFKDCDKLTKVTISQTVEDIGYDVFEGCSEELTFAVDEGNEHFAASEEGSELSIDGELYAPMPNYDNDPAYMPLTVTPEGEDYSENAENQIPQKLAALPRAAAPGKSYSTGAGEEAVNRTATQSTGVLGIHQARGDGTTLLTYCKQAAKGHIIIPDGVTEIQENLFCREEPPVRYPGESDASFAERQHSYNLKPHMNITRVTVPDSVKKINWRFIDCKTVERVDLGKGVREIDNSAFASLAKNCVITVSPDNPSFSASYNILYNKAQGTALRCFGYTGGDTLALPDMVKTIEGNAFRTGLDGVKTVVFNEGLQKLEWLGFHHLPDVEEVYIPASVTTIENGNFCDSGKLKDIYFGGTAAQWNAISLGAGEGLTTSLPNYRQVVAQKGITVHFNSQRPNTPTPPADPAPSYEPNPTGEPTGTPSPTPTPTAKPTAKPTASPTAKPTASPTAKPTAKPTGKPVEIQPEVTVEDGKAAAALTEEQGEALVANAKKENADAVLVKLEPPAGESWDALEVTLPAGTVEQLGTQSSASLGVETGLGKLSVPSRELTGLARGGESVSLSISRGDDSTVEVQVKKDGAPVEDVSLKVQLPPPENLSLGNTTVAFQINPDGTETLLPKSAPDAGSNTMTVLLSGGARIKLKDNAKTFDDAIPGWAQNQIDFMSSRNLLSGVSAGVFAPSTPMSRAMLVQVLYSLEGKPEVSPSSAFGDVQSQWYAKAALWGHSIGIVAGINGNFAPNLTITREQLALILYQYAKTSGMDTSVQGDLSGYKDEGKVSGWASAGMRWAVGAKVIGGSGGNLDPKGKATRAQVAVMLTSFIKQMTEQA